jgi:hypothetical protein
MMAQSEAREAREDYGAKDGDGAERGDRSNTDRRGRRATPVGSCPFKYVYVHIRK